MVEGLCVGCGGLLCAACVWCPPQPALSRAAWQLLCSCDTHAEAGGKYTFAWEIVIALRYNRPIFARQVGD